MKSVKILIILLLIGSGVFANSSQSAKVYFLLKNITIKGTCCVPQERWQFYHTCVQQNGASETTCYCTFNYPQEVKLKCNNNTWYIENFPQQCTGTLTSSKKTKVDLSAHKINSAKSDCHEPEVLLNFFNSCERKQYPAQNTSCLCTYNKQQKINFTCNYHDHRGLTWIRVSPETPCKDNFDPTKVHCYNDSNGIVCRCIRNCLKVDINANYTYNAIEKICNKTEYFNYNKESKLISSYLDDNSFEFQCRRGYKLNGSGALSCNFGVLNGSVPQCIKIENTDDDSNTSVISFISWCFIAKLLIDITILIFVIIYLLGLFKKLNGPRTPTLNAEVNLNEVQTTQF